jgi:hypothetical protein
VVERLKNSKSFEIAAQILAIASFAGMAWVASRTLQIRTQCLSSSFIAFVQIGGERVENCRYESRLSLRNWTNPLTAEQTGILRRLEVLEPLTGIFPNARPRLAVEINSEQPRLFQLGRGWVRLGREWLDDPTETRRALIMTVLKRERPETFEADFELELTADFLLLSVMGGHSLASEVKLPTSAPSFQEYCKSPLRSLAHFEVCSGEESELADRQANAWGFRPLLAAALARMYAKAGLKTKLAVLRVVRLGTVVPSRDPAPDARLATLIPWFEQSLRDHMSALHFPAGETTERNFKSTMRELDVESPIHWELTVDITNTPAWKEILTQFKSWSQFHPRERTLVFTPEGAVAFPSGLPVAWSPDEIQSQTHVLIACEWPKPDEAVSVNAQHVFARQSCGKVDQIFWN